MNIRARRLPALLTSRKLAWRASQRLACAAAMLAPLVGVAAASAQVWEVGNRLLTMDPQTGASFGGGVAVGDLDGDGRDDLAVGAPSWDAPSGLDSGLVLFYLGSATRQPTYLAGTYGSENGMLGMSVAFGDFDGDDLEEVAVGMPFRDVYFDGSVRSGAGAVVLFGYDPGSGGLVNDGMLTQSGAGNIAAPEDGDAFGMTLATGDFNGDGYQDLAVAAPYESIDEAQVGAVQILFGSAAGLEGSGAPARQTIAAGVGGVAGVQGEEDYLGYAMAGGDFNGDGKSDLAIGAPGRAVAGAGWAGEVHVLHGSAGGLTIANQRLLSDSSFIGRGSGAGDGFGGALAAADFDGQLLVCLYSDCYDDLAIGIPGKTVVPPGDFPVNAAGEVLVVKGTATGFGTSVGQYDTLSQLDVAGDSPESGDAFGRSLASGWLDGGDIFGSADLAVGAPYEKLGAGPGEEGFVQLFFGSSIGLDGAVPEQAFGQLEGFAVAPASAGDHWGEPMAIGDLDGDGWGDLVIGVPHKAIEGVVYAGGVQILYGALFADGFERNAPGAWTSSP